MSTKREKDIDGISKMKSNLWSSWAEYLNVSSSEMLEVFSDNNATQTENNVPKPAPKRTNFFSGHSEYDDFYLVCRICGKTIKPQFLTSHIELRHKYAMNNHRLPVSESGQGQQQPSPPKFVPPNCSNEISKNHDISLSEKRESTYSAAFQEQRMN